MALLKKRVDERGVRNDVGDAARLDVADEMPGHPGMRGGLAQQLVGAVLAEITGARRDGAADLLGPDRFRDGDQRDLGGVASDAAAFGRKLLADAQITLGNSHGAHYPSCRAQRVARGGR